MHREEGLSRGALSSSNVGRWTLARNDDVVVLDGFALDAMHKESHVWNGKAACKQSQVHTRSMLVSIWLGCASIKQTSAHTRSMLVSIWLGCASMKQTSAHTRSMPC